MSAENIRPFGCLCRVLSRNETRTSDPEGEHINRQEESKMKTRIVFVSLFAIALAACEGMQAEYNEPDVTIQSDAGPAPDVDNNDDGSEPDASNTDDNGQPDTDTQAATPCVDADGDGYCTHLPNGQPFDCNDSAADSDGDGVIDGYLVHPGAAETCDLIDNNCNGEVDEGLEKALRFVDTDGDGYGDINDVEGEEICAMQGYSLTNDDCDDAKPTTHPGAEDKGGDGIDSDCDDETAPEDSQEPELAVTTAKLTAKFAKADKLSMTVQLAATEADLGKWWNEDLKFDDPWSDQIVGEFHLTEEVKFVRLNVTVGGGGNITWLCNGDTALEGAAVTLELGDGFEVLAPTFGEIWLDPAGGCSILFKVEYKP